MAIKETCHKIPQISSLPISQNLIHIHQNSPRLVCSNHMQPFKLYIKKLLVCVSKEIYKHINIKIFLRGLSPSMLMMFSRQNKVSITLENSSLLTLVTNSCKFKTENTPSFSDWKLSSW